MNLLAISVSKLTWGVIPIQGISHKLHVNPRINICFSSPLLNKKKSYRKFVPTLNDATGNVDVGRCIGVTPRILNLKSGRGKAVSFATRPINPQYPMARRRLLSQNWFGDYGEWKIYDTCQETNPIYRFSNQESSPYTDWAISTNHTVLMSSSTASFRNIYNHVGNSITISSADKMSLNKTRGK